MEYFSHICRLIALLPIFFFLVLPLSKVSADDKTAHQIVQNVGKGLSSPIPLTVQEQAWLDRKHTVRVRINDFPPHMMTLPEPRGISVDYLRLIGKRFGINFNFIVNQSVQWKEAVEDLESNRAWYDLLPTMKRTSEREKKIAFTQEYLVAPWVIVNRTDSPYVSKMEDLNGKSVAVERGYVVEGLIRNSFPRVNIIIVKNTLEALNAVASGITDAYVGNLTVATYFIQNGGLHNLKIAAPTPFGNHDQEMAVRNDWPELVSIINKSLMAMPDGDKSAITSHWFTVKYEYGLNMKKVLSLIGAISAAFCLIIIVTFFWNRRLKHEINERHLAEVTLRESEERFKALSEASFGGIIIHDNGLILECNRALTDITGFSYKEHVGMNGLKLIAAESLETVIANIKSGYDRDYEVTGVRKNGSKYPLAIRGKNIIYMGHDASLIELRDITERKDAEAKLLKYRLLVDNSNDAIYSKSLDGTILTWNPSATRIYGYSAEEIIGRNFSILLNPEDLNEMQEIMARLIRNENVTHYETVRVRKDGKKINVSLTLSPIRDEAGVMHEVSIIARDITERIHSEIEREAAQARIKKLEGIIPICMYCKKIRDDENSWNQLEQYISNHSEAMFSHGICPHCYEEQYGYIKKKDVIN